MCGYVFHKRRICGKKKREYHHPFFTSLCIKWSRPPTKCREQVSLLSLAVKVTRAIELPETTLKASMESVLQLKGWSTP